MKMDEHARAWAHEYVAGLLAGTALPPEQRNSFHWEILNHLHEGSERRASERGGTLVTLADVKAEAQALGGREGLLEHFNVESRVAATPRAGVAKRFGAFVIDVVLAVPPAFLFYNIAMGFVGIFVPWERFAVYDFFSLLFAAAGFALVYGYLAATEYRWGATVGKMVFRLRVVQTTGGPIGLREAAIRNVAKVVPPLLALDAILYLIAFQRDDQRASDRVANTIVIDTVRAVWSPVPPPAVASTPLRVERETPLKAAHGREKD